MTAAMSGAMATASSSLPSRYFVAISQADAALMNTSFASPPMARRARRGNRSFPFTHQMKAWVSSSSRNYAPPSHRANSSGGSGCETRSLNSSHSLLPFIAPNCLLPRSRIGASRATGLPFRAMTTSSPASTCAEQARQVCLRLVYIHHDHGVFSPINSLANYMTNLGECQREALRQRVSESRIHRRLMPMTRKQVPSPPLTGGDP